MRGSKDNYYCIIFTGKFPNAIRIAQACVGEPKVIIAQHVTTPLNSTVKSLVL